MANKMITIGIFEFVKDKFTNPDDIKYLNSLNKWNVPLLF